MTDQEMKDWLSKELDGHHKTLEKSLYENLVGFMKGFVIGYNESFIKNFLANFEVAFVTSFRATKPGAHLDEALIKNVMNSVQTSVSKALDELKTKPSS